MTIKKFIEKAIEGGWKWISLPYSAEDILGDYDFNLEKELLNPELWKAVGKVEGWGLLYCIHCGAKAIPVRTDENAPEYWDDCCTKKRLDYGEDYTGKMHGMIDALCEGKSIEEYLSTL